MRRLFLISHVLSVTLLAANSWANATEQVLYGFKGGADGAFPSSSLVMDSAGNLYGTASEGGNPSGCVSNYAPGCGVVFELASVNGAWQESVLYAFLGGSDGESPSGNLVFDASGNLYGTTSRGGTGTACGTVGCGTVFELSPNPNGGWTKTSLYNFRSEPDGAFPVGLTFDGSRKLYGITTAGGSGGRGVVYELSRSGQDGPGIEKVIYSFSTFETQPNPVLVFDSEGNLYGTYYQLYSCYPGCGAVFQLKQSGGIWTESRMVDFSGGGNGGEPMAGVILDNEGNLYGTGAEGGNNWGMAFEIKRSGSKLKGIMLHNFCSLNSCADGAVPQAGLVMDTSGVLYGTTSAGGRCPLYCGSGVVFKLTHTKYGWEETVLHAFQGGSDGTTPNQSLILDGRGNLYGTTSPDPYISAGYGTVFEVMQ
jgi:hypothetical protein